jgi:hypothetical protein
MANCLVGLEGKMNSKKKRENEESNNFDDEERVPGDKLLLALGVLAVCFIAYKGFTQLGFETTFFLFAPFIVAMGFVFTLVKWIDPGANRGVDDED